MWDYQGACGGGGNAEFLFGNGETPVRGKIVDQGWSQGLCVDGSAGRIFSDGEFGVMEC